MPAATTIQNATRPGAGRLAARLRAMPPHISFMLLVTGAYLTVEVPFSAHLLDVMGGDPTTDDIDTIEHFGRLLTGLAVAIAVMGHILAKRAGTPFARALLVATFWGAISVAGTFHALNQVAEYIGRKSDGEGRSDAYQTMMARRALIEGLGESPGLPRDGAMAHAPEWRAFLSVAPAMAVTDGALLDWVRADRGRLVSLAAERRVGDAATLRARVMTTGFDPIREAYADYAEGSAKYEGEQRQLLGKCRAEWDRYMDRRGRYGLGYGKRLTGRQAQQIREEVRKGGIPVTRSWHPDDIKGFCGAYIVEAEGKLDEAFDERVSAALGKGRTVPPGLAFEEFAKRPPVQERLREEMGIGAGPTIHEGMSDADFERGVRIPLIAATERRMEKAMAAPAEAFGPGGMFEREGEEAAKAVFVPSMAIVLSIAGAALHLFKFTYLLTAFAARLLGRDLVAALRLPVAAAVTGCAGLWLVGPASALTQSEGYASVRGLSAEGIGTHAATVLTVAVDMQRRFYPIGHAVGEAGPFRLIRPHLPPGRNPAVATAVAAAPEAGPGAGESPVTDDASASSRIPVPTPRPDRA